MGGLEHGFSKVDSHHHHTANKRKAALHPTSTLSSNLPQISLPISHGESEISPEFAISGFSMLSHSFWLDRAVYCRDNLDR